MSHYTVTVRTLTDCVTYAAIGNSSAEVISAAIDMFEAWGAAIDPFGVCGVTVRPA